ncbi:hypothetical protein D3C84_490880 [compost metagenome]
MNPEAPSLGSSTNANEMKHTPNAPPAHIHSGALLINVSEGNGKRNARMIGSSTRMLTTREARVAHNGWPNPRPRLTLIALWKGTTAPANVASSNRPAQCNVLMFLLQQVLLDCRVFVAQI